MTKEKKQSIDIALNIFMGMLKEEGLLMGIEVYKDKDKLPKIVFLDVEKAKKGERDGVTVDLDEINKQLYGGN